MGRMGSAIRQHRRLPGRPAGSSAAYSQSGTWPLPRRIVVPGAIGDPPARATGKQFRLALDFVNDDQARGPTHRTLERRHVGHRVTGRNADHLVADHGRGEAAPAVRLFRHHARHLRLQFFEPVDDRVSWGESPVCQKFRPVHDHADWWNVRDVRPGISITRARCPPTTESTRDATASESSIIGAFVTRPSARSARPDRRGRGRAAQAASFTPLPTVKLTRKGASSRRWIAKRTGNVSTPPRRQIR